MNGHVKFFKAQLEAGRRWGQIEPDDKKGDVFFHEEHIQNKIMPCEGTLVEFSLNPDYPKRRALQVIVLGKRSYGPVPPTPIRGGEKKETYGD